jgi:hypothetical protein
VRVKVLRPEPTVLEQLPPPLVPLLRRHAIDGRCIDWAEYCRFQLGNGGLPMRAQA